MTNETKHSNPTSNGDSSIQTGNFTNVKGVAIGPNAQAFVYEGLSIEEVATLYIELKNRDQPIVRDDRPPLFFEPTTTQVAGGPFPMGSEPVDTVPDYETPRHIIALPAFGIGIAPVSNAQYATYLQRTDQIAPTDLRWRNGTSPSLEQELLPVIGVTWHEALAYCTWLTGETERRYGLPSEAQWERAAMDEAGVVDVSAGIREWTTTLWGEKRRLPDPHYGYPWQPNDGRDDVLANVQIRRVIRGGMDRLTQRSSELPLQRGLSGSRIGFRVVVDLEI